MKSIVLLSAGLDSTVNLFLAREKTTVTQVLTFDYGQKAAPKEIEKSAQISKYLGLSHKVISLPWLSEISASSLNKRTLNIPTGKEVEIDDLEISKKTAQSVWVPNRNGLFLNIAGSFADAADVDLIIPGFNKEEASTFPDNSHEYMNAATDAFSYSTSKKTKVISYTIDMDKTEIIRLALEKNIPLDLIWPCYLSGDVWCGQCESCQRTKRAMKSNNIDEKKYFKITSN